MEREEISVVSARASHLHSKLNQAIDSFYTTATATSTASLPSSSSSSSIDSLPNTANNSPSELHSLVSIRDALESLQDHLDSLQALQLQQRAERDFGLAEIEESRRVLLKLLKEHKGRELEIIREAFTFAGGKPSEKNNQEDENEAEDEVEDSVLHHSLCSHPHVNSNGERKRFNTKEGQRLHDVGAVVEEDDDEEEREEEEEGQEYEEEGRSEEDLVTLGYPSENNKGFHKNAIVSMTMNLVLKVRKLVEGSITFMRAKYTAMEFVKKSMGFLGQITQKENGNSRVPCSKGMLVMVATIALLSLTNSEDRNMKRSSISRQMHRSRQGRRFDRVNHGSSWRNERWRQLRDEYEEDRVFPKCLDRERVELPFFKASHTPDVLHGRG